MKFRSNEILIEEQTVDKVKIVLQEFENKYQNYKSRWDFEIVNQKENQIFAQLVDHSYETPRGKGQSDSPVYEITLSPREDNVLLTWCFRWKRSKSLLSWILLALLLLCGAAVLTLAHGDKLVLFSGIWSFCAILYGGWLLQNYLHDLGSRELFEGMLYSHFKSTKQAEPDFTESSEEKETP